MGSWLSCCGAPRILPCRESCINVLRVPCKCSTLVEPHDMMSETAVLDDMIPDVLIPPLSRQPLPSQPKNNGSQESINCIANATDSRDVADEIADERLYVCSEEGSTAAASLNQSRKTFDTQKRPVDIESSRGSAQSSASRWVNRPVRPFSILLRKSAADEKYGIINDCEAYNAAGDQCLRITALRSQGILFPVNMKRPLEERICAGAQIRCANGCSSVVGMREEMAKDWVELAGFLPAIERVTLHKTPEAPSFGLRVSQATEDPSIIRILGVSRESQVCLQGCFVLRVNGVEGADLLEEELRNKDKSVFTLDIRYDHVS
eukprot:GEMP01030586.1.p1 GENE.GEMP01030586.1~~GEMP01030586.1.p1  ORF type:complete len:320 (+),score=71.36 GEMP01030586.1:119-1078(+)